MSTHEEADLLLQVAERRMGAEGVVVVDLIDSSGGDLPTWTPGAHLDLELREGLTRQYSLCGEPGDRTTWRIAVLRESESRGGSRHVHEVLTEGTQVRARGPRNHFPLVPSPRYLFIAGGIGITPILPMMTAAQSTGADWKLHYGGRSRRSMAFLEALEDATGNLVTFHPEDEVGLIDLPRILGTPRPETLVYACGPEPLLNAIERECKGWPEGSLHVERFRPKDVGDPVLAEAFTVELASSGITLTVPPGESILEVVEKAGIFIPSSCGEGTCGTCETSVLDGLIDHRDSLLTPDEQAANDAMFICVSRAACPKLVLDL